MRGFKILVLLLWITFFLSTFGFAKEPPYWILKSRNLRDIGGWERPGWGPVKEGLFFRSRALDHLSDEELAIIKGLNLKTIVDLRSLEEIQKRPDDPRLLRGINYFIIPFRSIGDITSEEECQEVCNNFSSCRWTGRTCSAPLECTYVYYVLVNKDAIQNILYGIANLDVLPVLFHCEYGVDRGGVLSAIFMYLLGVNRDEIMTDYVTSALAYEELGLNVYVRPFLMEKLLDWLFDNDQSCTNYRFDSLFQEDIQGTVIKLRYLFTPDNVLIPPGAIWKYNDLGSEKNSSESLVDLTGIPNGAWRTNDFLDDYWFLGTAPFGFSVMGRESEIIKTEINSGFPVYYFRKTFSVSQRDKIGGLKLKLLVDDGAIVYLNGHEILRVNVPEDIDVDDPSLYSGILQTYDMDSYPEKLVRDFYREYLLPATYLKEGENLVAVQVYQSSPTSSDLIFDLELLSLPPEEGFPGYGALRTEAPQVLAAGFDPAILPGGEQPVNIIALVRPGASPVQEVKAFWGQAFLGQMALVGVLRNGDEVWALPVVAPSWAQGLLFGADKLQIKAFGSDNLPSSAFPVVRFLPENSFSSSPLLEEPFYNLPPTTTSAPQLLACGINPSLVPLDATTVEVLAIVRPGANPVERVLLYQDGLPVQMQLVGKLPNGDLIYAVAVDLEGLPGQELNLLELGWNILAYDDQGGVSNPCFSLKRY